MPPSLALPRIIGHRGVRQYAPENTLAGLHAAADMGVEWVEVDVKLTRDGVPILFHDEELDRTTSGTGRVADTDWADIRELDAGSWFAESFTGEPVPSLEDAIDVLITRGLGVNLEIKPCPGREKETAEALLDIASTYWPDDRPPPLLSSFQHVSIETALDMIPDWPRGYLFREKPENWKDMAEYLQVSSLHFEAAKALREDVLEYLETGRVLAAYTVNVLEQARELVSWGVDALFTDMPDIIRDAVEVSH